MFKWLRNWIRPIKCFNFDCESEWNGICKKQQIHLGAVDSKRPNVLICTSFRQVHEEFEIK